MTPTPKSSTLTLPAMLLVAAALSTAAASCGSSSSDDAGDCGSLLPGDLVITEIMANPAGSDSGNEWFEIYNASSEAITLTGLTLFTSREDGTSEEEHEFAEVTIEAGQYLVVGSVLNDPTLLPPHVDYGDR